MSAMNGSKITKETLKKMFAEGKRFDSRGLLDFRDLKVSYDVSHNAEGSARVNLGKTEVIAGVKLSPGNPYPDSPNKGNLMVSGDLISLASPRFESGPPGFNAIELPRLLDRAIRESGMLDMSKLVITPGEKVWTLHIDVYPINDDGNLMDAALIACIAALKKAVLPGITQQGTADYKHRTQTKLPLSDEIAPLSFSFYKFGDSIIMDPTREEEESADVRISFGISKWNGQFMINSCQKSGETPLSTTEVEKMAEILPKKFDELSDKLKKFL